MNLLILSVRNKANFNKDIGLINLFYNNLNNDNNDYIQTNLNNNSIDSNNSLITPKSNKKCQKRNYYDQNFFTSSNNNYKSIKFYSFNEKQKYLNQNIQTHCGNEKIKFLNTINQSNNIKQSIMDDSFNENDDSFEYLELKKNIDTLMTLYAKEFGKYNILKILKMNYNIFIQ